MDIGMLILYFYQLKPFNIVCLYDLTVIEGFCYISFLFYHLFKSQEKKYHFGNIKSFSDSGLCHRRNRLLILEKIARVGIKLNVAVLPAIGILH